MDSLPDWLLFYYQWASQHRHQGCKIKVTCTIVYVCMCCHKLCNIVSMVRSCMLLPHCSLCTKVYCVKRLPTVYQRLCKLKMHAHINHVLAPPRLWTMHHVAWIPLGMCKFRIIYFYEMQYSLGWEPEWSNLVAPSWTGRYLKINVFQDMGKFSKSSFLSLGVPHFLLHFCNIWTIFRT